MKDPADRPAAGYRPIRTKRAFEEVAGQIRDQLARGSLRVGDRLPPERELARQFNLSRNSVREALRALEIAGILELRKGAAGGAVVRETQGETVVSGFSDLLRLKAITPEDFTEARIVIACAVTRFACRRGTAGDLALLQQNLDESEEAALAGDLARRIAVNLEFHRLLARATQNPVFIVLTEALSEMQSQLLELIEPAPNSMVMPSRRRLLGHLLARDEDAAASEMESNLRALRRHYRAQRP